MKTIVHWVGGKKQLLPEIRKRIVPAKKYYELFVGGGAVLIDLLENNDIFEEYHINDINSQLCNVYSQLKFNSEDLIKLLSEYKKEYNLSSDKEHLFLNKRKEYNLSINNLDLNLAALFIFLNKTCFNGLYRVNKKGEFNCSFGKHETLDFDFEDMRKLSEKLQKVIIHNNTYYEINPIRDAFVFMDPPYRPVSITANFASYDKSGFNDEAQRVLAMFCNKLNNDGNKFLLCNSFSQDGFFQDLYKNFNISYVQANRAVNCDANNRGKVKEIMVTN